MCKHIERKHMPNHPDISIHELQTGSRPLITEREFAYLRGCSQSTLQKERVRGRGAHFLKDPHTGRIFYLADDVIAFLARSLRCRSTSEYDTSSYQSRLSKARNVLSIRSRAG
jgi:hypothetical protein